MLTGKTALITGSTSGIGLAMSRALAAEGCNIMLNGFGERGEIERICSEIESTFNVRVRNGRVLVHPRPNAAGTRVEPARIS